MHPAGPGRAGPHGTRWSGCYRRRGAWRRSVVAAPGSATFRASIGRGSVAARRGSRPAQGLRGGVRSSVRCGSDLPPPSGWSKLALPCYPPPTAREEYAAARGAAIPRNGPTGIAVPGPRRLGAAGPAGADRGSQWAPAARPIQTTQSPGLCSSLRVTPSHSVSVRVFPGPGPIRAEGLVSGSVALRLAAAGEAAAGRGVGW